MSTAEQLHYYSKQKRGNKRQVSSNRNSEKINCGEFQGLKPDQVISKESFARICCNWQVARNTYMLHVISAWCVARDLHTIEPGPLERTCWIVKNLELRLSMRLLLYY